MTASSTTITISRRETTLRQSGRILRAIGALLSAVRTRWNALLTAGQLGPMDEAVIGRHTGARI